MVVVVVILFNYLFIYISRVYCNLPCINLQVTNWRLLSIPFPAMNILRTIYACTYARMRKQLHVCLRSPMSVLLLIQMYTECVGIEFVGYRSLCGEHLQL